MGIGGVKVKTEEEIKERIEMLKKIKDVLFFNNTNERVKIDNQISALEWVLED